MKEDGKDQTWKDKTGRKYQSYGAEQRLERAQLEKGEDDREELKDKKKQATSSLSEENEVSQSSPSSFSAAPDPGS